MPKLLREPEETSRIAWVKRVEYRAKQQTIANFDRKQLETAIPEILACAEQVESIVRIPQLLADLGVHFVIVPRFCVRISILEASVAKPGTSSLVATQTSASLSQNA